VYFFRCRDHQPSDGLGAHKLVLATASSEFLKSLFLGILKKDFFIIHLTRITRALKTNEILMKSPLKYKNNSTLQIQNLKVLKYALVDIKVFVRIKYPYLFK